MRGNSQIWLNVSIGLLLCLVVVNAGLAYRQVQELRSNAGRVAQTHEVLEALESAVSTVKDAETGQRGYLLTGDESYLAPYQEAMAHAGKDLDKLERLAAQDALGPKRVTALKTLVAAKLDELAATIALRKDGEFAGAREVFMTNQDRRGMDRIRALVDEMQGRQRRLLVERQQADERAHRSAVAGVLISALAGVVGLVALLRLVRGHLNALAASSRAVAEHRAALLERTKTLEGVNVRMNELVRDLKASEELFHTMADGIPQLAWMARPDGHIYWYNERWYEYTGTTPAEVEGWGWQCVHDPGELPRVLERWKDALARGEAWEDTFPIRRRDGAMRWHLSRAEPLRNERGEITCWFGTNTDITERLEMEASLREADRRKDEFLATLAHELRNPIAPISNALQIWPFVEHDRGEMEKLRAVMEPQVRQMTRLIDDLLDVARITQDKIQLRLEVIDLAEIVAGVVDAIRPQVDACGQRLEVQVAEAPLLVRGDAARLTQALGNLVQNAAKYTGPGDAIRVSASRQGDRAMLCVEDSGVGIPPDVLPRVFDMFEQGDRTMARAHGGLGLGLTLVKRLVELHGGSAEAHSEGEGKGSRFLVWLPIRQPLAGPVASSEAASAPACARALARRRILVVDDVRASASTLAMMLDRLGQEVATAHDGSSAIEQAAACRPDVVFLDIAMPGLSGYDVARQLRASPRTADVVLVALTGYGNEEDRRKSLQAGFDHHLTKPTSIAELAALLRSLPEGERAEGRSASLTD
jgi:PAS domain S-box-containing protein